MKEKIKHLSSKVKAVNDDGSVRFRLTNYQVDRHGEVVVPDGVDLTNFKNNPIVLFGHGFETSVPIGKFKPNSFEVTKDYVDGDIIFDDKGLDPFAEMIGNKVRNGFLNMGSIGFMPKTISNDPVLPKQTGVTIQKWEPYEFSVVPIPSNTGAAAEKEMEQFRLECKSLMPDMDDSIFASPFKKESTDGTADNPSLGILGTIEKLSPDLIEKAGRVLSSKNRTLVKNVADEMRGLLTQLDILLEATEPKGDTDSGDKDTDTVKKDNVLDLILGALNITKLQNDLNELK